MSKLALRIGDSDKYSVDYEGSKESFLNSGLYKEIRDKVFTALKEEFPEGGYEDVVRIEVEECKDGNCADELNDAAIRELQKSAKRQIEVKERTEEQNLNAPFDKD